MAFNFPPPLILVFSTHIYRLIKNAQTKSEVNISSIPKVITFFITNVKRSDSGHTCFMNFVLCIYIYIQGFYENVSFLEYVQEQHIPM